jgi:hypothetical protein
MDSATATPPSRTRQLAICLFRAIYAKDLAVREAQVIGLWIAFLLVWAPLMVVGEPIYELLFVRGGLGPVCSMFISLGIYMLPARWIAGRISATLLERQRQRIAQGRARALDGFWGPFLVGASITCVVGALFTYLWIESPPIALISSAVYFLSGLVLKPWQTPLRQAVAAGILFGIILPGMTVGLWVYGR